jgi:hypothetical protein
MNAKTFLIGFSSFLYCSLLSLPLLASASLPDNPEEILGFEPKSIEDILGDITGWLVGFGVSLCLLALIWGGLNYVASLGSQEQSQKAKKTITYALLGLLVIGFSYAIVALVDSIFIPK